MIRNLILSIACVIMFINISYAAERSAIKAMYEITPDNRKIRVVKDPDVAKYLAELYDLPADKLKLAMKIYVYGDEFDLGYSLIAVAWKESQFGKYLFNVSDGEYGSFGLYHIRLDYAAIRNKITTDWGRSRYAEQLLHDFNVSSAEAVTNLLFWKEYFKNTSEPYRNMFSGYNGGTKGPSVKRARAYGNDIIKRVKALKIYFKDNNIIEKMRKSGFKVKE